MDCAVMSLRAAHCQAALDRLTDSDQLRGFPRRPEMIKRAAQEETAFLRLRDDPPRHASRCS